MYVVLIGLGICFFAKRVHVLVKDFKDYQSLLFCRNFNVFCLYISKTIKVFCLTKTSMSSALYISKTIKVFYLAEASMSSAFTFQRLSKSFVLQRLQYFLPFTFQKLSMSLVKTSTFSLHFKDFNVFCQDFNVFFTSQRLECLLSRL